MKSRILVVATIIASIMIGSVAFSTAADQSQSTASCCSYMKAPDCQQQAIRGAAPDRIQPADSQNYPLGLKYRTGA